MGLTPVSDTPRSLLQLARNIWTGATYGFVVWNAGYEGWLPLLGILPPAHRDARGRAITMLVAPTVYGVALGATAELQRAHFNFSPRHCSDICNTGLGRSTRSASGLPN